MDYGERWNPESNQATKQQAARWMEYLDGRSALARQGRGECFGPSAAFRRAEVERIRGRVRRSLNELRTYFEDGGTCAEAYFVLGRALLSIDVEGADDALRRALAKDREYPGARLALARLAATQGDADTALELLEEETRLHPDAPEAYLEAGLVHERLRNDATAAGKWFAGYEKAGGNPEIMKARRRHWGSRGES